MDVRKLSDRELYDLFVVNNREAWIKGQFCEVVKVSSWSSLKEAIKDAAPTGGAVYVQADVSGRWLMLLMREGWLM